MNARVRDPARAALQRVLQLTVEKQRFPLESTVVRWREGLGDAVARLLDDRRYLGRVVAGDNKGPFRPRVALTVAGTYELPPPLQTGEIQGLTVTRERLAHGLASGVLARQVRLKDAHAHLASDLDLFDFRRWCTTLTSPRLQGRYTHDAIGFGGWADATGVASKQKGFFTHLCLHPSFQTWQLPQQEPPRSFLLSETGPYVEVDGGGGVHVFWGTGQLGTLPSGLGGRTFAALVRRPRDEVHSLDLQIYEPGRFEIPKPDTWDDCEVADALFDLGIDFDTSNSTPEQVLRMAAVIRRVYALEAVARSSEPPPRWAREPTKRRADLVAELSAVLKVGPLCADFPLIKNSTKVVGRALDDLLHRAELEPLRGCFSIRERIVYTPPA